MGVFQAIGRALGIKASATSGSILGYWGAGNPVYTPDNYERLAREGYRKSVYVYRSVEIVSQACGGIPLVLSRRLRNGETEELVDHPLLTLLSSPNPQQSGAQLIENLIAYRLLAGNSYLERVGPDDPRKPPMELWALRPDRMRVVAGTPDEPIREFEYTVAGRVTKIPAPFVLHGKTFNPLDDFYGMPPLVAAARSVDQNNAAKDHNVALQQNSARPSGILNIEGALDEKKRGALLDMLDARWAGLKNAGRPMVLEKGMGWQQMSLTPVEMDWIEGSKLSAQEIVMVFGVSMVLLNPSEATYANMAEARKALYQDKVLPLMGNLVADLNRWLVPLFGLDLFLAYNTDKVEALQEERGAVYTRTTSAFTCGYITLNDSRDATGYDDDANYGSRYRWEIDYLLRWGSWPGETVPAEEEPDTEPVKRAKSFNLVTEEQKAAHWKAVDKLRQTWEKVVAGQAAKQFQAEHAAIMAALEDATPETAAKKAIAALDRAAWVKQMTAWYTAIMEDFGARTIKELKSQAGGLETKADEEIFDLFAVEVDTFIKKTTGNKVTELLNTTKKRLRSEIKAGMDAGEGMDEIAKRIDGLYLDSIIPNRSMVIARTEVMAASSSGSQYAARSTGLDLEKEWIATRDQRTRESHAAVDGQTQKMDDPYIVDGAQLRYPGDPDGPASEVIQCRCSEGYSVIK